ncbi:MAG: multidrug DMT transporter permease [Chitinophagaceae bacterium]|nr:multidrug DMT transporter permease [Chitinophagaceae bacterium]
MFIVHTYAFAVLLSVVTMLCWGSWPNMQKLVSKAWRFELFYWDYVLGIVLIALLSGFTAGSLGSSGRTFLEDIGQADSTNIFSAMLGGAVFNLANILFVAAIAVAGMSVAFPVGAGVGLILGVLVNYIAAPVGNGVFLFFGVGLITAAIVLSATAHRNLSKQMNAVPAKGILLSLLAGVLFGFFYRFIAGAMAADFETPEAGKLGPYAAVVFFSLGVLLSNFLFNTVLMKKPISGEPVSYAAYFKGSGIDHLMGVLGGAIWGTGLVLSILTAGKAGFAISFGLGQGNAMIAAIWGVFVWKEFAKAPARTDRLLYGMFGCYIAGLIIIILSRLY